MKPILFNTEMVRAILEGRKTVTRRVVKFEKGKNPKWTGYVKDGLTLYNGKNEPCSLPAPYQVNDILYVRETWRVGAWDIRKQLIAFDYKDGTCGELVPIHDSDMFNRLVDQARESARKAKCKYNGVDYVWDKGNSPCQWKPSIHMPKEAARLFLKVTDVRVEKLRNMKLEDFIDEGITLTRDQLRNNNTALCAAREIFKELWNSTLGKRGTPEYYSNNYYANPYVWVIEFEVTDEPTE